MRKIMFVGLTGLLLLGAGCQGKATAVPGTSGIPPEQRMTATPAEKPTAAPEIPDAAKNVPRPEAN